MTTITFQMSSRKQALIIALLLVFAWQARAQTSETPSIKRNELKIDVAYLIGSALKMEYEYFLNDWSSIGIVGLYNFGSSENQIYKAQALGKYRLFFGKQTMSGFFLEGNFGVTSGKTLHMIYPRLEYTAFGAGIALGCKWHIPKSNVVMDVFGGLGRLFGKHYTAEVYPRVGICVGKRF